MAFGVPLVNLLIMVVLVPIFVIPFVIIGFYRFQFRGNFWKLAAIAVYFLITLGGVGAMQVHYSLEGTGDEAQRAIHRNLFGMIFVIESILGAACIFLIQPKR